jgi:integrase
VKIGGEVNKTRMVFKYGVQQGLIEKPVQFGNFKRTDRKTLRVHRAKQRAEHGPRMFAHEELRRIIDAAPQPLRSMVYLGINGGLSNMDVATLYFGALDLEGAWLNFPRGKTGTPRRIPLWQETVASIRDYLATRPEPKSAEDAQLVFLTPHRLSWVRRGRMVDDGKGGVLVKGLFNPVAGRFSDFLKRLGINGKRNFLALRHTFRTIARGARDREAIDALMGHVDESMASHYIEDGLPDERLKAVTEHVRTWLVADEKHK